jgi:hypothetical protein
VRDAPNVLLINDYAIIRVNNINHNFNNTELVNKLKLTCLLAGSLFDYPNRNIASPGGFWFNFERLLHVNSYNKLGNEGNYNLNWYGSSPTSLGTDTKLLGNYKYIIDSNNQGFSDNINITYEKYTDYLKGGGAVLFLGFNDNIAKFINKMGGGLPTQRAPLGSEFRERLSGTINTPDGNGFVSDLSQHYYDFNYAIDPTIKIKNYTNDSTSPSLIGLGPPFTTSPSKYIPKNRLDNLGKGRPIFKDSKVAVAWLKGDLSEAPKGTIIVYTEETPLYRAATTYTQPSTSQQIAVGGNNEGGSMYRGDDAGSTLGMYLRYILKNL